MIKNLVRVWIALCCFLPILIGCVFIPHAGLDMNEILFAVPYYQPTAAEFQIHLLHHAIPLMVMTYIGTLKTLLYWPLFAAFRSSFENHPILAAWVVRLPMVLVESLTVFAFFHLARRAEGIRAAAIAALLLATDPTFLLTGTFDWGPVALEHLFLVTGCFFAIRFAQRHVPRDLALAFFAFGLGIWNKAVFSWALGGLVCACAFVFWREIAKLATPRRLLCAAACFAAGALPLMIYNARHRFETFHSNAHLEPAGAPAKFIQVRMALEGSGLFAFLVSEDWYDNPKPPASALGQAAFWIRRNLGEHRAGGLEFAAALALLAVPLWWRSRAARFCLIFMAIAWFLMASTRGAGTAQHHTVLLWPFPQLFAGIVLSNLRWRWAAATICLLLAAWNLLVLNQYLVQFERNGADGSFTDAINRLSAELSPTQTLYVLDWGIQFPLYVLRNGSVPMTAAHQFFTPDATFEQSRDAVKMLADRNALLVTHADKREFFEGVHKRFDEAANAAGCRESSVEEVPDSNGRPVFELFNLSCGESGP